MKSLTIKEEQSLLEFKEKVSLKNYKLILKVLRKHTPHFSSALFEIFNLAIEKEEKTKNRIFNLFRKNPKNATEIFEAIEILKIF